jgi:hypothetical protein
MPSRVALLLAAVVGLSVAQAAPPEPDQGVALGDPIPPLQGSPEAGCAPPPPQGKVLTREGVDFDFAYLLWWLKKGNVPPLVTTSAPADAGVLGAPTTQVLFGGQTLGPNPYSGGRFRGNVNLDPCWDFEVGGFFLSERRLTFAASGGGPTGGLLAIPTISTVTGLPSSVVVTTPGGRTAGVTARLLSRLWGVDAVARAYVAGSKNWAVNVLFGAQYADLTESLRLGVSLEPPPPITFESAATRAGSVYQGLDNFHARNQFFGGVLGAGGALYLGDFVLAGRAQIGLGASLQQVNVHGAGILATLAGTTTTVFSDILAQPGVIGGHNQAVFAYLPEVGLTVGYQLTCNLYLFAGYDAFYWSRVVRPGDQISGRSNPALVPFLPGSSVTATPVPPLSMTSTDFWAQGLTCGFRLSF